MTTETKAACIQRLEEAIAACDYDYAALTRDGDHLRAEQKRLEGLQLRRAHRRFTEHRPTLIGLDMASGAAPVKPDGRYRLSTFSLRQALGLEAI